MQRDAAVPEQGIWVRLALDTGAAVTGFAPGADSPNDFWTVFKTQLVRLRDANEIRADGSRRRYDTIYVNRDRIVVVDVATDVSGNEFNEEPVDA